MLDDDTDKKGDEGLIERSKKCFDLAVEAERQMRKDALDDLNFRKGDQWPETIKLDRQLRGKPCLTLNVLPARERQVLNDQRQNRPAVKVHPVDDSADPETAKIIEGIIRHIEYDSNADAAIDTASAAAVRGGFGYLRLLTEFEDESSFQQVIKIKRIVNAFTVYMGKECQEVDYSDASEAHIIETLTKAEYKQQYPDSELASLDDWDSLGAKDPEWLSKDSVKIAEYFYRDSKKDVLILLQNSAGEQRAVLESKLPGSKLPRGVKKLDERETEIPIIRWCKHNALEALSKTVWKGKWVPIIPVLGDELIVDGKRTLEGLVRHAKDAIRMKNVMASAEVQAISMAPQAQWLVETGQIEGYEKEYQQANKGDIGVLHYHKQDVGGRPIDKPERIQAEPAIQAISQAQLHFSMDLEDITGIYPAQYGKPSNEKSGRAIDARRRQGEISNFHFSDNVSRALRFLGLQLVDLIPKIYTEQQVMRIIGDDGTHKSVMVNGPDPRTGKIYDLNAGRYDVTISSGPSYQTKRLEGAEWIQDAIHAAPGLLNTHGDLFFKVLDLPYADQMAERSKKLLPPNLQDDANGDPAAQAQQLQAKLAALMQQHQELTQHVQEMTQIIETKQVEANGRLQETREKIQAQVLVAEITTKAQNERERMKWEHEVWRESHQGAHELALQNDQQGHEQNMAEQNASIASDQAQQQADLQPPATQ